MPTNYGYEKPKLTKQQKRACRYIQAMNLMYKKVGGGGSNACREEDWGLTCLKVGARG